MRQKQLATAATALVWGIVALLALQIPLRPIAGGGLPFTAFEFIGPLGGAFFGAFSGALAALGAKGIGAWLAGGLVGTFAVARLLTPAAAAIYLDGKQRWILLVSIASIFAFVIHPVGGQVWSYSLYWLIPLLVWPYRSNLFLRSLGSTFTAHALGGALFIWLVPSTPGLWLSLIPIVALERVVFASGMTLALLGFERVIGLLPAQFRALALLRTGRQLRELTA